MADLPFDSVVGVETAGVAVDIYADGYVGAWSTSNQLVYLTDGLGVNVFTTPLGGFSARAFKHEPGNVRAYSDQGERFNHPDLTSINSSFLTYLCACRVTDTRAIAFIRDNNGVDEVVAVQVDVDPVTLDVTMSDAISISGTAGVPLGCDYVDADRVIAFYKNTVDNKGYACMVDTSGVDPLPGTLKEVTFFIAVDTGTNKSSNHQIATLTTVSAVATWVTASAVYTKFLSISDMTITTSTSEVTYALAEQTYQPVIVRLTDTSFFVVGRQTTSNFMYQAIGNVPVATITLSTGTINLSTHNFWGAVVINPTTVRLIHDYSNTLSQIDVTHNGTSVSSYASTTISALTDYHGPPRPSPTYEHNTFNLVLLNGVVLAGYNTNHYNARMTLFNGVQDKTFVTELYTVPTGYLLELTLVIAALPELTGYLYGFAYNDVTSIKSPDMNLAVNSSENVALTSSRSEDVNMKIISLPNTPIFLSAGDKLLYYTTHQNSGNHRVTLSGVLRDIS